MKTLEEHNQLVELVERQRSGAGVACDKCGKEMVHTAGRHNQSGEVRCPECGYLGFKKAIKRAMPFFDERWISRLTKAP